MKKQPSDWTVLERESEGFRERKLGFGGDWDCGRGEEEWDEWNSGRECFVEKGEGVKEMKIFYGFIFILL